MKKVIVFRVEDVLVKDFNKEDSLRRAVSIETNKLKKSVGLDVLEREIKKKGKDEEDCEELKVESMEKWKEIEGKVRMKEKEKKEWVERREREFYDREFERSKFKSGIGEIMKVLKGMKETREYAEDLKLAITEKDKDIGHVLVPNCIYRCGCPEMNKCGLIDEFKDWCKEKEIEFDWFDIKARYNAYNMPFSRKGRRNEDRNS